MRKLLAALLLLALPSPAAAVKTGGALAYTASHKPYYQRIAVLYDDRDWQTSDTRQNQMMTAGQAGLGRVFHLLKEQGADIHYYTYSFMEGIQDNHSATRWRRLGEFYPVVVVLYQRSRFGSGTVAHRKRYFRPESTSAHVIHWGGYGDNFQDEDPAATADSLTYGTCSNSFAPGALGATRKIVSTTTPGDTLNGFAVPYHVPYATRPPSVGQLVRLFAPVNAGDQDSVVDAATDTMMWGWRVYAAPGATNHATYSATPWMEYVAAIQGGAITTTSHVLLALVYRYTRLEPIRMAINWDDCGNFGAEPSYSSGRPINSFYEDVAGTNDSGYYQWRSPRAGYMDSLTAQWKTLHGAIPTFSGQADSMIAFYNGSTTFGAQPWLKRRPFSLHVHSRDSTSIYGNPFGQGASNDTGTVVRFRVVGFRRDPTHADAFRRYGIYNKIKTSDSLMLANGFAVGPWIDHAQNAWSPDNLGSGSGATLLTQDSVYQAMGEAGKFYQRGYQDNQSTRNTLGSADGTAQITRIQGFPDTRYYYRSGVDGKVKKVWNVGTTAITSSGANGYTVNETPDLSQVAFLELLGLRCSPIQTLAPAHNWGESGTIAQGARHTGLARVRVIYNHPKYFDNRLLGYHADPYLMEASVFGPLRTLGNLAGKPIHRWVEPWQVYGPGR